MFIKTCKYCGNKFETKRYPTVFCSQSCYFKYKRAKANENRLKLIEAYDKSLGAFLKDGYIYFKKKCAHCGNEFYANKSTGKYCCQKCHDEASWERSSKRRKAPSPSLMKGVALKMMKTCEMCGKSFVSQKITTRFCSSACARKFRNTSGYGQTEKIQKQKTPLEPKDLMRISEAAEYLSISRTTLYRALWDGAFEVSEVHGVYLIRKSSIDEYLASNSTIFKRHAEKDGLDNPEVKIYANPIATTPSEYITLVK